MGLIHHAFASCLYNVFSTTMSKQVSEYDCWRAIDYKPALLEISADNLAPYLRVGQKSLEIGCHWGRTTMWLADHGLDVLGIDINLDAILQARTAAEISNTSASFMHGDFLDQTNLGTFDLVVMVRALTCFSSLANWRAVLSQAFECVVPGGLLYIHDFVYSPENEVYRERYKEGKGRGWRTGNFSVLGSEGRTLFIAHHHSIDELSEIMNPYEKIFLNLHDSVSMNGNPCRMFEFLGKRSVAS